MTDPHQSANLPGRKAITCRSLEAMWNAASPEAHAATAEAAEWLDDYLNSHHGSVRSADIKADGAKAGHSYDALKRGRKRLDLEVESVEFPRVTFRYSKALIHNDVKAENLLVAGDGEPTLAFVDCS
jgi:hypothetical protein